MTQFTEGLRIFKEAVSWKPGLIDQDIGEPRPSGRCCVGARLALALGGGYYDAGVILWTKECGGTLAHVVHMLRQCGAPDDPFAADQPWDVPAAEVATCMINKFEELPSLRGVDLSGADLTMTPNWERVDLGYLDLSGADLTGTRLDRVILTHANLTEAVMDRATLKNVVLSYATLTRARMTDTDLYHADLNHADLTAADLTQAYLCDANLQCANLTAANLTKANLINADLDAVNLTDANMEGVLQ